LQKKAARRKTEAEQRYQQAVARWQAMTAEQRRFRPELDPANFKP
jgi:hypothetical protein